MLPLVLVAVLVLSIGVTVADVVDVSPPEAEPPSDPLEPPSDPLVAPDPSLLPLVAEELSDPPPPLVSVVPLPDPSEDPVDPPLVCASSEPPLPEPDETSPPLEPLIPEPPPSPPRRATEELPFVSCVLPGTARPATRWGEVAVCAEADRAVANLGARAVATALGRRAGFGRASA